VNPYQNLQFQNPGNAFLQAYEGGRERRRESETQNALTQYAMNPQDPKTKAQLARWNPKMAIEVRQHEETMRLKQLEGYKDQIQIGAAILEANPPRDQASWDMVRQMAGRYGINAAELPQTWDATAQQYVQGVIAANKRLNPDKDARPSDVKSWEYRQSLPEPQRPAYDAFIRNARPQIFGSAEGGYNIYDPNAAQPPAAQQPPSMANMPRVTTPQEAAQLPPGTQFVLPDGRIGTVPGGAGGNASGGFPIGPQ
jgi:hypothetical protein